MEPTKIDKQFREGLKNREIRPSAAAWDKLDAMLAVAEKPKKTFSWMYVAASFIGLVIISSVLYFQSDQVTNKNNSIEVVGKENIIIPNQKINENREYKKTEIAIAEVKVSNQNHKNQRNKTILKSVNTQKTGVQSSASPINQNIVQEIVAIPNKIIKSSATEHVKVQQQPKLIDPASLLADIENKNAGEKTTLKMPQAKYKSDPKALLAQVDGELDQSFREKVFTKIAKNYQTIKVAVSERNNK